MKKYETPSIIQLGSLAELTQGQTVGDFLDATFPIGTPNSELTFTG